MTENDDIKNSILSSGIPSLAIATTLPKEGADVLRKWVQERQFDKAEGGSIGAFLHPRIPSATNQTRRVFHVLAKEMVLSGVSVYSLPLERLVTGMTADYDNEDFERADVADVTFVTDFYERGASFPLQPWQAGAFRSWAKRKIENEKTVCLLSEGIWKEAQAWWTPSFLGFLQASMQTFAIG